MDPHARDKAQFYLKQVTAALSPSNFVGTNPELLRTTLAESGENLVRGLKMMAEDIEAGKGNLRIRQVRRARRSSSASISPITPGKVIFRNELIELIQYAPTTPQVYKRPLLIVPPWINKFYILDLNPEKSFIRWAVAQGLTVFVISWVNPDERHADKGFDAYMREGILAALDCVEQATGEREVAAIGYCVGGTLLAATLAYMAAVGDDRIDERDLLHHPDRLHRRGRPQGVRRRRAAEGRRGEDGRARLSRRLGHGATPSTCCRPNDLIWSYYVNNYLKGKEPMPFDLLVWNSDSTRMPAANHKFYLRHCYLQNDLSNGRMELGGKTLDLKKVTIPVYELATQGGPYRACALGVHRRKMLRRPGALRDGGLRPYRGRRQSARQAEIPVLERRPARGRFRRLGRGPRRRRAPGGPTGSPGSPPRRPKKSPPARPATAS